MGCREDRSSQSWEEVLLGKLWLRLCSGFQAQQPPAGTWGWDTHSGDRILPPDVSYPLSILSYQPKSFSTWNPIMAPSCLSLSPRFAPQPSLGAPLPTPHPWGKEQGTFTHFLSNTTEMWTHARTKKSRAAVTGCRSCIPSKNQEHPPALRMLGAGWMVKLGVHLPHLARHHS